MTCPEIARVAVALSTFAASTSCDSNPSGTACDQYLSHSSASSGFRVRPSAIPFSHLRRAADNRFVLRAYSARTSSGTKNVGPSGQPRFALVALTSSAPSGSPGAAAGRADLAVELRRAPADDRPRDDDRRPVRDFLRAADGLANRVTVVPVDLLRVPADAVEALLHILGERQARFAFDGDVGVVVEVNDVTESEVAGDGRGLGAAAFLARAVGADAVDVVIDRLERIFAIEARGHHLRAER